MVLIFKSPHCYFGGVGGGGGRPEGWEVQGKDALGPHAVSGPTRMSLEGLD